MVCWELISFESRGYGGDWPGRQFRSGNLRSGRRSGPVLVAAFDAWVLYAVILIAPDEFSRYDTECTGARTDLPGGST